MSFSCERIRREFDFRPWRESAVSGFGALARPWKEKDGRKTRSGARSKKQARHGTPSQHDDCQTGHVIIQRSRLPRVCLTWRLNSESCLLDIVHKSSSFSSDHKDCSEPVAEARHSARARPGQQEGHCREPARMRSQRVVMRRRSCERQGCQGSRAATAPPPFAKGALDLPSEAHK